MKLQLNFTQAEISTLLKITGGLPPYLWLERCETEDQRQHWIRVKSFFTFLQADLGCYFSGQSPLEQQEGIGLWRDRFLRFYDAIYEGWAFLKDFSEKTGFELPDSPGETMAYAIEQLCRKYFEMCKNPYEEWSVREAYKGYQSRQKLKPVLAKSSERWTAKERKQYRDFIKESKEVIASPDIELICVLALRQCNDKRIRSKVSEFQKSDELLDAYLAKNLHPRNAATSFAWKKGELIVRIQV